MKVKIFILIISLWLSLAVCDDQSEPAFDDQRDDLQVETITVEEHVYVLDDTNYDTFIAQHRVALVEFYAPWCGHCKALAPEYSAAAKILSQERISLAKVDGSKYSELARSYDIQGYPTLFVYLNGTKIEYDGPRTEQGIVDHMRSVADPSYKPPKDHVLVLTDSNFDSILEQESLVLVEFYAPWCGHCKRLVPEYERAARRLTEIERPIKLAKVDATEEKELAKRFEVKGYPTLIIFRNGGQKRQPYKGPRDESGIVEYMKSMQLSPSKLIQTKDQLRKQIQNDVPTIVGFFPGSGSSSTFDVFIDVAYDQFDANNRFVHVEDQKLVDELKQKQDSVLVFVPIWLRSKYEPAQYKLNMDASSTSEQLLEFISNHSRPLVGFRNAATLGLYGNLYPQVVVYYDVDFGFDNLKQTQLILAQVQQAAAKLKKKIGEIHFVIAREADNEQELKDLKLDDSGEDINVAYFASPKRRWSMEPTDEFNAQVLQDFVQQVRSGELKPVIKSAFAPDKNPVRNLWTVVGDTFERLILKSDHDSLIEFYAPWCGHCKQLEPIYKQLAEQFEVESDRIRIAKIDATVNDYPEQFQVQGFPTLFYVRASDPTNPIPYNEQSRSLEDLTKFIHDNLHGLGSGPAKSDKEKDEL